MYRKSEPSGPRGAEYAYEFIIIFERALGLEIVFFLKVNGGWLEKLSILTPLPLVIM